MAKLHRQQGGGILLVAFKCPGCGLYHSLPVEGPHAWTWNGSVDSPTLSPSILARNGHYAPGHSGRCWCTYAAEHPECDDGFKCGICHSFVRDGKIQFLADCTHALAGKTVDIPEWED